MIIKMILTNSFDPDPRVYKEAKTLTEQGADVEILAWDRENKNKAIDTIDGIKIKRFYSDGKYGAGIKQLPGFINFYKQVNNYLRHINYDSLHCHDFDGLVVGYYVAKGADKVKLVYDEHDLFFLYFDNRKGLLNKLISKFIKVFERHMLKKVDNHIVVTPNMKRLYKNKSTPIVITNAPMESLLRNVSKLPKKKTVIGFIGSVRYAEELKVLIKASQRFSYIYIFIAGRGIKLDEIKEFVKNNKYSNVEFYGEYSMNELEFLYSKIDITYLVYPEKNSFISMPNKFFESIITKTPMIATAESEYGLIGKEYGFGWSVNVRNLEDELINIFKNLSKNNRIMDKFKRNMEKHTYDYTWESNANKLKQLYKL